MAGLTIDVDTSALLAAFDRIPDLVAKHVTVAAKVTADAIKSEALGRVARRTGTTASGITVDTARAGVGYVVFVDHPDNPGLPGWLEFGTKHMTAQPFLFVSARLEEGAHDRRMRDAIRDAIAEGGLGG